VFLAGTGRKVAQAGLLNQKKLRRGIAALASGYVFRMSFWAGVPQGMMMMESGLRKTVINTFLGHGQSC